MSEANARAAPGTLLVPPRPRPARAVLPLPLLLWAIRRNVLATWGEPAYRLDIVSRPFLGRRSFLVNDPAAIRHVLVDAADRYRRPPSTVRLLEPMIGRGLFLAEGADWKRQRRLLAPAFAPRQLARLAREAAALTDAALDALGPDGRGALDLLAWVQRLSLDIAARVLFSTASAPFAARLRAAVGAYGALHARPGLLDFVLPERVPGPRDLRRRRFARGFRALISEVVAHRAARPPTRPAADLFDALRAARDESGHDAFSPLELCDQVATLLIAGHETTALGLFWSFYLLALDQPTQDAVAAEAAAAPAAAEAAAETLARLPLTRAVFEEALRLYPPAFTLTREARSADELAGRPVSAGDLVVISPWVLHRHRRFWRDPDAFRPRRFLDGEEPVDRFVYLPFGAGPRVCIGARFALDEATVVLARTVARFRIELVGTRPVRPVGVVTIHPDRAPPFRLRPRDPAGLRRSGGRRW